MLPAETKDKLLNVPRKWLSGKGAKRYSIYFHTVEEDGDRSSNFSSVDIRDVRSQYQEEQDLYYGYIDYNDKLSLGSISDDSTKL